MKYFARKRCTYLSSITIFANRIVPGQVHLALHFCPLCPGVSPTHLNPGERRRLVAQGLSDRPTQDLDFFTSPAGGDVASARTGFQRKAEELGWTCSIVRDHPTFCRLILASDEREVLVDLALDSRPEQPPTVSILGPTFSPEELAGRKTIALFDRAEARDFADVFVLAARFSREELLIWAAGIDAGFDRAVFVQMLGTIARFADSDLPVPEGQAPVVRAFFADWAGDLRAT